MAKEVRNFVIVLLLEMLVILTGFVEQRSTLYFLFALYVVIATVYADEFHFSELLKSMKSGFRFWGAVIAAFGLELICHYGLSYVNSNFFSGVNLGTLSVWTSGTFDIVIYYFLLFAIEPLAVNLFYRKAIIRFDSPKVTILTTILGLFLISLLKAHGPIGIVESLIILIPGTAVYLITQNFYATTLALFGVNVVINVYSLLYITGRIVMR